MRLLVERGEIYKAGDRYIIVTSVHVDKSANFEGQVWVGCREVVADGGAAPSAFPDDSPLRGFRRGEPFTSYLTARDSAWRMNAGWELVGWGKPEDEAIAQVRCAEEIASGPQPVELMGPPKKRGRPPKAQTQTAPAAAEGTCAEHPGYRGMRKCRSGCKACEAIYAKNHPTGNDDLAD